MEEQAPYNAGSYTRVVKILRAIYDKDWRSKVYKQDPIEYPDNWGEIRSEIIKRDNYTCYRCEMSTTRMAELSVHHLTPRKEGGKENPENLITLCHPCHDIVEEHGLRTKAEIIGSYEGDKVNYGSVPAKEERGRARREAFERPSWHAKVYGGRKS